MSRKQILHAVCGKVPYPSRKIATQNLKRIRDEEKDFNLYSYACNQCGKYHIGHLTDPLLQQPLKGARKRKKKKPL